MDNQRIEGGVKKVTGTIKEKVGQATGDRQTEAEGTAEKTEGTIRSAVGKVKDAARELVGKK
ncbi:MAG: CsbD family protein [Alphaproteobacteria bacterium]|nr:CsbD family protein [Alphaproteobacteria bacterium]